MKWSDRTVDTCQARIQLFVEWWRGEETKWRVDTLGKSEHVFYSRYECALTYKVNRYIIYKIVSFFLFCFHIIDLLSIFQTSKREGRWFIPNNPLWNCQCILDKIWALIYYFTFIINICCKIRCRQNDCTCQLRLNLFIR